MKILKSVKLASIDNTNIFKAKDAGAAVPITTHWWVPPNGKELRRWDCKLAWEYCVSSIRNLQWSWDHLRTGSIKEPIEIFISRSNFHLNNCPRNRAQPSCFAPSDRGGEINRHTINVTSFEVWFLRYNRWKDRQTGRKKRRKKEWEATSVREGMAYLSMRKNRQSRFTYFNG